MLHYGAHPTEFFEVLWRTLHNQARLHFYGNSFIGLLGWLDVPLPGWFYVFSVAVLGVAAFACMGGASCRQDVLAAGAMCVLALASVLIIFFAMLATWTAQPAIDIDGVQGRYFMQPALMFAWAMSLAVVRPPVWLRRIGSGALMVYFGVAVLVSSQALLTRYWL